MDKERILLGSIMIDNSLSKKLIQYPNEIFIDSRNVHLFKCMKDQIKLNKPIDLVSLVDILGKNFDVGYLASLVDDAPNYLTYFDSYLDDLNNKMKLRKTIQIGEKVKTNELTWEDAIKEFKEISLNDHTVNNSIGNLQSALSDIANGNPETYFKSCFNWIDDKIGGWPESDIYIIIAGRPSDGKTTFALNIASRLMKQGIVGGIFSSEMSRKNLANIIVSNASGVNSNRLRRRMLTDSEEKRVCSVMDALYNKCQLLIDDTPTIDISELEYKAEIMVKKGARYLIIDYLQIIRCALYARLPFRERINEISASVKRIARIFNLPVFALSQLKRDAENRRPTLSDLKESGALEQDGDLILFLHNNGKNEYNNDSDFEHNYNIIIGKNKYGATGDIPMIYQKDICRFIDK